MQTNFAEKDLGVLVDKLNMKQQCALATDKTNGTWAALGEALPVD